MKPLRTLSIILAVVFIVFGIFLATYGASDARAAVLGHTLIIAGAILVAGAVIASAIAGSRQ